MNKKEIQELLKSKAYDFLRTNEHLGENLILLTLGGSYAYGLNVETSDLDIRGVFVNKPDEILGMKKVDRIEDADTDSVFYSLDHFLKLCSECNPNIIEIIGADEESILYVSPLGQKLLDHKHLFITKKAARSFSGYAEAQMRRLTNALNGKEIDYDKKVQYMFQSVKRQREAFIHKFQEIDEKSELNIKVDKNKSGQNDILVDINLHDYPLRDFAEIINGMRLVVKEYDSLGKRNSKKDIPHINKHAMHLIRLYKMGIEILKDGEIKVRRVDDREELLSIRNGCYMDDSGRYLPTFDEYVDKLSRELKEAKNASKLPEKVDLKAVNNLLYELNLEHLRKG